MADETAGPERDRPAAGSVGSVAEETARLLDALLAGTSGAGEASGRAYASSQAPAPEPARRAARRALPDLRSCARSGARDGPGR